MLYRFLLRGGVASAGAQDEKEIALEASQDLAAPTFSYVHVLLVFIYTSQSLFWNFRCCITLFDLSRNLRQLTYRALLVSCALQIIFINSMTFVSTQGPLIDV